MLSTAPNGDAAISVFIPNAKSGGGNWEAGVVTPSFVDVNTPSYGNLLNVGSFTATTQGDLYVTDSYGNLHQSNDGGRSFKIVDTGWENITAAYDNAIIGIKGNAGSLSFAAYPTSAWPQAGQAVPAKFPVEASSGAAEFSTKWATLPQIVITGGKTA